MLPLLRRPPPVTCPVAVRGVVSSDRVTNSGVGFAHGTRVLPGQTGMTSIFNLSVKHHFWCL